MTKFLLHLLQLFHGLLQAEQLFPNFLGVGLCRAQGATPRDPIPFLGRPCPTVFLRGKQELLQGQHFLKGLGSKLALRAGPAVGQEGAEDSLRLAVSWGHLSATTVAIL